MIIKKLMAQKYVLSALATNFRPHLDYYKPAKALHHLFLSKILFNYESSCYKNTGAIFWYGHKFSALLGKYQGVQLLDCVGRVCLVL